MASGCPTIFGWNNNGYLELNGKDALGCRYKKHVFAGFYDSSRFKSLLHSRNSASTYLSELIIYAPHLRQQAGKALLNPFNGLAALDRVQQSVDGNGLGNSLLLQIVHLVFHE